MCILDELHNITEQCEKYLNNNRVKVERNCKLCDYDRKASLSVEKMQFLIQFALHHTCYRENCE